MKYRNIIIVFLLLFSVGCSVVSHLERRQTSVEAQYAPRGMTKAAKVQSESLIEIRKDSNTYYLAPAVRDENGEMMMTANIDEVVVFARSRTVSERGGKVSIDFVVSLPKELQGACRSVSVVPYLHKMNADVPLQELSIRGGLFSRVQDRNYWQYSQYVRVFRPDAVGEQRAFERFVKYPYPQGVRLDSIVEGRENISYYYTQDVATIDEGKKMLVTLHGRVIALDGSYYPLPVSDTLQYNISSMLSFVDTTTHYATRIIKKYEVAQDRNYLSFKVNDTQIIDTLGDNRAQLGRIEALMGELVEQCEFYVDSVVLTASASPEGAYVHNARLAKERALSLKKRLAQRFGNSVDTLISLRAVAENWDELSGIIAEDDNIAERERIMELIATEHDPDKREAALRRQFPHDYDYIRRTLYPRLRSVSFRYHLRRRGMVQDTVHTLEPDTEYARGVALLGERRYADALLVLRRYNDRNTAIALLSLGYDEHAYDILSHQSVCAVNEYLLALACSRLGMIEQGRDHFIRSCNMDETFEYRGSLDPEIGNLLKGD